jgi:hypothetical protein
MPNRPALLGDWSSPSIVSATHYYLEPNMLVNNKENSEQHNASLATGKAHSANSAPPNPATNPPPINKPHKQKNTTKKLRFIRSNAY